MQKDQTEAEEVTEKLKTTDRLEGGVCMCAWDSAYVWREMGEGGGVCLYVCMAQCICMERDGERGGGAVCMCAWGSVYVWREMGEGGVCPLDLPRSRPLVRVALPAILFARPFPFTPAYPVFSTGSLACTGNRSCDRHVCRQVGTCTER